MPFSGWHLDMKGLYTGGKQVKGSFLAGLRVPTMFSQALLKLGIPRCAVRSYGPSGAALRGGPLFPADSEGRSVEIWVPGAGILGSSHKAGLQLACSPQLSWGLAGVLNPGSSSLPLESCFGPRERVKLLSWGLGERWPW